MRFHVEHLLYIAALYVYKKIIVKNTFFENIFGRPKSHEKEPVQTRKPYVWAIILGYFWFQKGFSCFQY